MKPLFALALALALAGCTAAGKRLHRLSPGMEKHRVIAILGQPRSVAADGGVQVLHYKEGLSRYEYYFVRLVDGRVESFGPESKERPVTATHPPLRSP